MACRASQKTSLQDMRDEVAEVLADIRRYRPHVCYGGIDATGFTYLYRILTLYLSF
jgi:hypothetical protein